MDRSLQHDVGFDHRISGWRYIVDRKASRSTCESPIGRNSLGIHGLVFDLIGVAMRASPRGHGRIWEPISNAYLNINIVI